MGTSTGAELQSFAGEVHSICPSCSRRDSFTQQFCLPPSLRSPCSEPALPPTPWSRRRRFLMSSRRGTAGEARLQPQGEARQGRENFVAGQILISAWERSTSGAEPGTPWDNGTPLLAYQA